MWQSESNEVPSKMSMKLVTAPTCQEPTSLSKAEADLNISNIDLDADVSQLLRSLLKAEADLNIVNIDVDTDVSQLLRSLLNAAAPEKASAIHLTPETSQESRSALKRVFPSNKPGAGTQKPANGQKEPPILATRETSHSAIGPCASVAAAWSDVQSSTAAAIWAEPTLFSI